MQSTTSDFRDSSKDGSANPTANSTMSTNMIRLVRTHRGFNEAHDTASGMRNAKMRLEGKDALCEKIRQLVGELQKLGEGLVTTQDVPHLGTLEEDYTAQAGRDPMYDACSTLKESLAKIVGDLYGLVGDSIEDPCQGSDSGEAAHGSFQIWEEPSEETIKRLVGRSREVLRAAFVFDVACDEYKKTKAAAAAS